MFFTTTTRDHKPNLTRVHKLQWAWRENDTKIAVVNVVVRTYNTNYNKYILSQYDKRVADGTEAAHVGLSCTQLSSQVSFDDSGSFFPPYLIHTIRLYIIGTGRFLSSTVRQIFTLRYAAAFRSQFFSTQPLSPTRKKTSSSCVRLMTTYIFT